MTPLQKSLIPRVRLLGITFEVAVRENYNRYGVKYLYAGRYTPVIGVVFAKDEMDVYLRVRERLKAQGYALEED